MKTNITTKSTKTKELRIAKAFLYINGIETIADVSKETKQIRRQIKELHESAQKWKKLDIDIRIAAKIVWG